MKYEHKELIHDYLNIDRQNERIEQRIKRTQIEFHSQNIYGGTDFNPLGVRSKGFRVDSKVSDYVDNINACERNIAKNKRRKHHFSRYIKTLDQHTYSSLNRRYGHYDSLEESQELGHDEQVLDEILEIEEAISYEFDTDISSEHKKEVLQVEYTVFSDDTVEQSFEAMQELLGV